MPNRMKSAIYINGNKLDMDYPQFNDGSRNIKVPRDYVLGPSYSQDIFSGGVTLNREVLSDCKIHALLFSANSTMDLLLVCEAVKAMGVKNIHLTIPYVPYSRQDRRCVEGEAHSLAVMASLINSVEAESVTIYDPHSDVCEALIKNVKIVKQHDPIVNNKYGEFVSNYDVVIAPDGGAIKKAFKFAQSMKSQFESAVKFRNIETGQVEKVIFNAINDIDGKRCIVVDDCADGGASFSFLAKEIMSKNNPKSIDLYVTHGLFVNGTKDLYEVFENIYTLDYSNPKEIKVVRLSEQD